MAGKANKKYSVNVQGGKRLMKSKFKPLCCYFHSAYVSVRVVQVPKRGLDLSLLDSPTSTADNSVIFKADDWSVLDVRWLRITLKITEITRFEACFPLYIDARNSFCIGDEPKSGLARDLGDCLQSRSVPFGTSGDSDFLSFLFSEFCEKTIVIIIKYQTKFCI